MLYADESGEVKSDSLKYLNRLSDYLFVMARYANLLEGVADVKSKPAGRGGVRKNKLAN